MLLFKIILLAILLICAAVCVAVFISRKNPRSPRSWNNIVMLIFFVCTCHNLGVKYTIISLLYLSVCAFTFILLALSSSKTKFSNGYKTIYSALLDVNNPARMWSGGFSYNKFKGYSNLLLSPGLKEEQSYEPVKFNKLLHCALVPLWLIYFISKKAFNNSFRIGISFYSCTFKMRNKIKLFLKNIKDA